MPLPICHRSPAPNGCFQYNPPRITNKLSSCAAPQHCSSTRPQAEPPHVCDTQQPCIMCPTSSAPHSLLQHVSRAACCAAVAAALTLVPASVPDHRSMQHQPLGSSHAQYAGSVWSPWRTSWSLPAAHAITPEQLLYLEAWRAVDRAYYDKTFNGNNWFKVREDVLRKQELDSRADTYQAITASLALLDDPFTRLLDPGRYAALKRGTGAGAITGVGLEVAFAEDKGAKSELVVVTPAPGGPADGAGIKPGDIIAAINGVATKGLSLYEAADLLQGAEGTQVQLSIRKGRSILEVPVTRQRLTIKPVSYQKCDAQTAYLRIAAFSKATSVDTRIALEDLKASGATTFVVDLRNNGGGYFPSSVDVARMLLQRGDIVLVADNAGVRDIYDATGDAVLPKEPLIVLINQGTGSAAEVLAGALKDNKRAVLVGETTFGKGLIQTIVPLSDGSAVAVTVARYQTPSGADINKKGIAPDVQNPLAGLPFDPPRVCKMIGDGILTDVLPKAQTAAV